MSTWTRKIKANKQSKNWRSKNWTNKSRESSSIFNKVHEDDFVGHDYPWLRQRIPLFLRKDKINAIKIIQKHCRCHLQLNSEEFLGKRETSVHEYLFSYRIAKPYESLTLPWQPVNPKLTTHFLETLLLKSWVRRERGFTLANWC